MAAINNLDKLTDKIYSEGIERAEVASRKILSKAEADGQQILEVAKAEAREIVADAQKEANRITRSTEKELQLKGQQLISDLKEEIQSVLSQKILKKSTKEAFADVDFIKSCILGAISSWEPSNHLELLLPKELESKLDNAFRQSVYDHTKNLVITFNDKLTGGFRISEKKEGFQVSFSEDDFITLFSSYLHKKTEDLLFTRKL